MRSPLAVLLAGLLLAGCGSEGGSSDVDAEPPTAEDSSKADETLSIGAAVVTLNGMAIVEQELDGAVKTDCEDLGGKFASLGIGEQIKLLDSSGATVAVAELEESALPPPDNVCAWDATFSDVPPGGDFYSAAIGEWESPAYPEDDLPAGRMVINAE